MGAEARPAPKLPHHKPPQRQGRAARERSKVGLPRASTAIRLGQGLGTSPRSDKARSSGSSAWGASASPRPGREESRSKSPAYPRRSGSTRLSTTAQPRPAACARYPRRRRERGHRPAAAAFPSGASEHPADDDLQPPRLVVGERRLAGARPVGGMGRGRPRP